MKLIWHDLEQEYEDSLESVPAIMEQLQTWLSSDTVASHSLRIDRTEIYGEYRTYLEQNIDDIVEIELLTLTIEEFAVQLVESISEYLNRAIPQLRQLYEALYQTSSSDVWDRLADLFDGMQWLHEAAGSMSGTAEERFVPFANFCAKIDELAPEFVSAVENRDAIALADMIQYEVSPVYVQLQEDVATITDSKVVNSHVS